MVVLARHGQRRPIQHQRRARNRDERRRPRRDRIRSSSPQRRRAVELDADQIPVGRVDRRRFVQTLDVRIVLLVADAADATAVPVSVKVQNVL